MRKLTIIFAMLLGMASTSNAQTVIDSSFRRVESSFQDIFVDDPPLIFVGRSLALLDLAGVEEDFTSFVSFELLELDGLTVESAFLEYTVSNFNSGDATEEFSISGGALVFGTATVSDSDIGSILRIDLNQAGIDRINESTSVIFRGSISTLDLLSDQIINFESQSNSDFRLIVETVGVPEPSSGIVLSLVGFGLATRRRRPQSV